MVNTVLFFQRKKINGNFKNFALLFFRIAVSVEIMVVHGFKKIGVGVAQSEIIPNPLGLPELMNQAFAIGANIIMPLFIIFGLFTRIASLPILCVTLTGYFLLHAHDPIAVKDIPYIYSVCFLFIFMAGPGKYSLDFIFFRQKNKR